MYGVGKSNLCAGVCCRFTMFSDAEAMLSQPSASFYGVQPPGLADIGLLCHLHTKLVPRATDETDVQQCTSDDSMVQASCALRRIHT